MTYFRTVFLLCIFSVLSFSIFAQDLEWIYKVGGITAEYGTSVCTDSEQNIYDAVSFMNTASVANNLSFISKGDEDILLRKSTSLGIRLWVVQIGGLGIDMAYDLSTDIDDNVYVVGSFQDSLYMGGTAILYAPSDVVSSFVLKISRDGVLIWARKFDTDKAVRAKSVTSGNTEELVISGEFEGATQFGSSLPAFSKVSNGGTDIFVLKMNGDTGAPIFIETIGGSDFEYVSQHTRDNKNNIYLTGEFRQILDFDPGQGEDIRDTKGLTDAFLLKLSSAGTFQWVKTYGGTGLDNGYSVACDQQNNVIITGRFSEDVDFKLPNGNMISSNGGTDAFVLKLDENGVAIWANSYGDTQNDQGNKVITNINGIIYLSGLFRTEIDLDASSASEVLSTSNGGADIFLVLLNQDGTYNLGYTYGGIANDQINEVALTSDGSLVSSGGFGAIVDFDPSVGEINVISTGGLDAFLVDIFICVKPYLKTVQAVRPEICKGDRAVVQIVEGYLNSATQWSWQRDSCDNITFASGTFIDQSIQSSRSYFVKGFGGCVQDDICTKVDVKVFTDSLRYQSVDLCQGDTIYIGNSKYTAPGVYIDSLISNAGCDSVLVTEINIFPKFYQVNEYEICMGDSIVVGTVAYTLPGTYIDNFSSSNGCDSTIVTTISILPSTIDNADIILCKGDSVVIGNATYADAGTFIQSTLTANGCEDLLIIQVTLLETDFTQSFQTCLGDSIIVGQSVYKQSGMYTDSLVSSFGCDSVIISEITFYNPSISQSDFAICEGDSVVVGSNVYFTTGNFIDTLQNVNGCDSIVFTDIRVLDVPKPMILDITICEGDSTLIGGQYYMSQGIVRDTMSSANGCDSIIIANLAVIPKIYYSELSICQGDSVQISDSTYFTSGVFTHQFESIQGCDSIVVVDLTVRPTFEVIEFYNLCPGDSIVIGGDIYREIGVFVDSFSTAYGCDSIITKNIVWNHVTTNNTYQLCSGDSIVINGRIIKENSFLVDTLQKLDGCDSIVLSNVFLNPKYEIDTSFNICKGEGITVGSSMYFNQGSFAEVLNSVNGCDSIVYFTINITNFIPQFSLSSDTLLAQNIEGASFQWFECINDIPIIINGATLPYLVIPSSGTYSLSATLNDCTYSSDCMEVIPTSAYDVKYNVYGVHPNPVHSFVSLVAPISTKYRVQDTRSQTLMNGVLVSDNQYLEVYHWPAGLYFITLTSNNQSQTFKIIKL